MDEQLRAYRDRGWESILTATPCDLWRVVRGRTLWVMGDSQSLDLFKALQCFLHECVRGSTVKLAMLGPLSHLEMVLTASASGMQPTLCSQCTGLVPDGVGTDAACTVQHLPRP